MPTKWQNGRTCSSAVVQFDLLIVGRKVIDESPSPHTKFSCQQQSKHVVSAAATPTPTPPSTAHSLQLWAMSSPLEYRKFSV